MEPRPLAVFGKSDGGHNKSRDRAWTMVMNDSVIEEGSPSIQLGLGIGAGIGSGQTHVIIKREKPVLLYTQSQLNELRQQSLIYKYLLAGLPVPPHLVFPIWKSLAASSLGSSIGCIYKQYPSFIGFSPQGFDYRAMMEPEPSRCRRTDGKKWRCKRDVVPNNKYCERHINRGRQRSRKHVEAHEIASPIHTTLPVNTNSSEKTNSYESNSVPTSLQLRTPTSDNNLTDNAPTSTIPTNRNKERNNALGLRKESTSTYIITTHTLTTTIASSTTAAASNYINKCSNNVHKDANGGNYVKHYSNVHKSTNKVDIGTKVSPVMEFSPKSVIQVQECSSSWIGERNYTSPEPRRCRRTDGKKWQCKNDVVPKSKYCIRHVHRGSKRYRESFQPIAAAAVEVHESANMNTNLSIAISANSPMVINDERSTTTSSSETISANSFINVCSSASHTSALSPP